MSTGTGTPNFSSSTRQAAASSRKCTRATWNLTRNAPLSRSSAAIPAPTAARIRRIPSTASRKATLSSKCGAPVATARAPRRWPSAWRALDGTSAARAVAPQPPPAATRAVPPPQARPRRPLAAASAPSPAPTAASRGDERRVDSCIRFAEKSGSQFGDATITNTCKFAVEVAYCYKGGRGGTFDCPSPPRMKRVDSLDAGATRNLPEYKRGSNSGVALVACKGTIGHRDAIAQRRRRQDGLQVDVR